MPALATDRHDLHAHSSASDGTDTPAGMLAAAAAAGLATVALTDHDTTDGWAEAAAARPAGLTVLPGAELSCWTPGEAGQRISLHLLAYLFDPTDAPLATACRRLRESRWDRGQRMVAGLVRAGYPISWEQVASLAADGSVGRPHVARALVAAGVVPDVAAAFTPEFLADGGRFYTTKEELPVLTALALVRAAGGAAVVAHPLAHRRGPVVPRAALVELARHGLTGLEVDHVDHDEETRARARALAAELGLLATGGSDYHGSAKTVRLGAATTPGAVVERLVADARGAAAWTG